MPRFQQDPAAHLWLYSFLVLALSSCGGDSTTNGSGTSGPRSSEISDADDVFGDTFRAGSRLIPLFYDGGDGARGRG